MIPLPLIILLVVLAAAAYWIAMPLGWVPVLWPPTEIGRRIANSMKAHPERWQQVDRYHIRNERISVWIANGMFGLGVARLSAGSLAFPDDGQLSWADRSLIYRSYRRFVKNRLLLSDLDAGA